MVFQLTAQVDTVWLLPPSGPFVVGQYTYEWEYDVPSSQDDLASGKRKLVVRIWYPSKVASGANKTPYDLSSPHDKIVEAHSYSETPFRTYDNKSPLVMVIPGRGMPSIAYSSIGEDLASHGFVVTAIDMPGIGYVKYASGKSIRPAPEYRPPPGMMAGPYERVDSFFQIPTDLGVMDIKFALSKIRELNNHDSGNQFSHRISMDKIGIFGHSLGGRIAGRMVVEVPAIKAYLAMEGIPPRDVRYEGKLGISAAMLCSSGTWPYAKENYFSLIDNRKSPVHMIELIDFGHNSLTDYPLIYPEDYKYPVDPGKAIAIGREIVRAYFNATLMKTGRFQDVLEDNGNIKYTWHK